MHATRGELAAASSTAATLTEKALALRNDKEDLRLAATCRNLLYELVPQILSDENYLDMTLAEVSLPPSPDADSEDYYPQVQVADANLKC